MPRHGKIHRRLLMLMLWIVAHPRRMLAGALVVLVACGLLAFFKLGRANEWVELA